MIDVLPEISVIISNRRHGVEIEINEPWLLECFIFRRDILKRFDISECIRIHYAIYLGIAQSFKLQIVFIFTQTSLNALAATINANKSISKRNHTHI